jgi:hypothetical protein
LDSGAFAPVRRTRAAGGSKLRTRGHLGVPTADATSVVALRLGFFAERPPTGEGASARDLPVWLSPRDCAQLLRRAVEVERTGFLVVNGVSSNRHLEVDLTAAEPIGYRPANDAWAGLDDRGIVQ